MSYQTEEGRPMLANKTEEVATISKKQSFGLAALMVLCLAATSFMAGHAYSSAATASAVDVQSSWSVQESCSRWISSIYGKCGMDVGECSRRGYQERTYDWDDCDPDGTCSWEFDILNSQCK